MNGRARVLLLCLLALAPAALARVLSYAPYSNRPSQTSIHWRGGRWFALSEMLTLDPISTTAQVVLYDALGTEEPRVVYPAGNTGVAIQFAAVYQNRFATAAAFPDIPKILISTYDTVAPYSSMCVLSIDGGKTFTRLKELDGTQPVVASFTVDYGGPYSRGLSSGVVVGDTFAFVLNTSKGILAIEHSGAVKTLAPAGYSLLGRDALGSKLLVQKDRDFSILGADGTLIPIGVIPAPFTVLNGWVTSDGGAYILANFNGYGFLYLLHNQQRTLVASAYDAADPTAGGAPPPYVSELTFFAVPTNDFDGAWMIQRRTGKPTTLLRHTQASGVETFWSDVSSPQVEALHTANDRNLLLLQVHRPRAQQQWQFIDPALALWRVGESAPRAYDELFLNEVVTKGFVHLNVDSLAGGTPFIFDSGSQLPILRGCPNCSPGGGSGGGGSDVIQEWGVVRASLKQRLVIPGVARQPGAFGSYWMSDVVIHNPLDTQQQVDIRYVPAGEVQIAVVYQKSLTLAPQEIRVLRDVLKSLFDLNQGTGVLHLEPNDAISATSRTYTRAPEGGSFGYGMQAIDFLNAVSPRFPVTFAGAFPGPEYRTNILLTDTSGRGTEARLRAHGLLGLMGADDVAFSAPTNGIQQMNGVAGTLGLLANESGGLTVEPLRGSMIVTLAAMDNRTNDPTMFPPDLPSSVVRTIPAVAHVDGANNSKFRTDLYLLNSSMGPRTVMLEAKRWDSNSAASMVPFTLLPGEARVIRDALPTLFGFTGIARLRYSSNGFSGDGVRVTSRTYNIREDGGTFGCLIPPLNAFQSAGPGETLEILGIVGGTEFRTNVGLVDLTPNYVGQNVEARIHIVDQTGKELDSFSVNFASAGGMQINDIFNARGLAQPAAAMVYVEVIRGMIGAYATLTDNVTNDSTYLGANLHARPN
ncbi:MAG TPA: hypothetical protein VKB93_03580 [Thermoanaerobaculia bacterium]|nr:hypothetical protein [Thermoanaerobaculia bacterium]